MKKILFIFIFIFNLNLTFSKEEILNFNQKDIISREEFRNKISEETIKNIEYTFDVLNNKEAKEKNILISKSIFELKEKIFEFDNSRLKYLEAMRGEKTKRVFVNEHAIFTDAELRVLNQILYFLEKYTEITLTLDSEKNNEGIRKALYKLSVFEEVEKNPELLILKTYLSNIIEIKRQLILDINDNPKFSKEYIIPNLEFKIENDLKLITLNNLFSRYSNYEYYIKKYNIK